MDLSVRRVNDSSVKISIDPNFCGFWSRVYEVRLEESGPIIESIPYPVTEEWLCENEYSRGKRVQ